MAPAKGVKAPPAPEPIAVLRGHATDVNALTFHESSGTLLLSGDADGEFKMWDLKRRRPLLSARLHGAGSGIIALGAGDSLGETILSQGRDGVVKCWQLAEGGMARDPLLTVQTGSYHFCKLAVLQSSSTLSNAHLGAPGAATCPDQQQHAASVCSPPSEPISGLVQQDPDLNRRTVDPANEHCPRGGISMGLKGGVGGASPLQSETGKADQKRESDAAVRSHSDVHTLSLDAGGERGVRPVTNLNEELEAREETKAMASRARQERTGVATAAGSGEDERVLIALAGQEPSVAEVWDVRSRTKVHEFRQLGSPGQSATPSSAGQAIHAGMCMALQLYRVPTGASALHLLAGYEDGSMAVWDSRAPARPLLAARLHSDPVLSVAVDRHKAGGVSGSADDQIAFFQLDHAAGQVSVLKSEPLNRPGVGEVALREDNRIVATAGWDNRVRVFDYRKRRALAILKYHSASVTGVAFSRDHLLASCSRDARIALWSIYPSNEK